tara:strand:+ start:1501 stop:1623 length:123 start_codon:yes stop_codon:yes gene_type:complete
MKSISKKNRILGGSVIMRKKMKERDILELVWKEGKSLIDS